jgi:peptidoglycan/xylan/chitin deacetylase (PgdA/CDA1 family)
MRSRTRFVSLLCIGGSICFLASRVFAQQREEVAITIDDLPVHGDLPPGLTRLDIAKSMIATLKAKGVPSVYGFINAKRADGDATKNDVLNAWIESGNLLGNHTYEHIDLTTNPAEKFEENIAANEATLQALMGQKNWRWFRYPFLHEGETLEKRHAVRKYLHDHGYKVAQVTLDFEDYAWNSPYARCAAKQDEAAIDWLKTSYLATAKEYITLDQKVAEQVYGRKIKHVLLLHIGAFDCIMLPELLDQLSKQGFKFVALEQAESDPVYQKDPDAALQYGGTLLDQWMDGKHMKYPPHAEKPMEKLNAICK